MARVSRFTEHFDYTTSPLSESQITLTEENVPFIKSLARSNITTTTTTTTSGLTRAGKAFRRLFTYYKRHFNEIVIHNFHSGPSESHQEAKSIEAGSISSPSYGAPETSAEKLEQQSKRNNLTAIFGLRLDDESSYTTFTAYTAKPKPTTAITKAHATAEPQKTPDALTFWRQVCLTREDKAEVIITGNESELENIEYNTMASMEYFGIEIEDDIDA